eukprot:156563-Amphidinium_carterae.1
MEVKPIAQVKTSQYILEHLPSGGPPGQWGRMYVTVLEEPQVCEVLSDVTVEKDGVMYVTANGQTLPAPARVHKVVDALRYLAKHNHLYQSVSGKAKGAVQKAIASLAQLASSATTPSSKIDLEVFKCVFHREPATGVAAPPGEVPLEPFDIVRFLKKGGRGWQRMCDRLERMMRIREFTYEMADRLWHTYIDALEAAIRHQRSSWAQRFKDHIMLRLQQQEAQQQQQRQQQEAQQQHIIQPVVIDLTAAAAAAPDPPTSPGAETPPDIMVHPVFHCSSSTASSSSSNTSE